MNNSPMNNSPMDEDVPPALRALLLRRLPPAQAERLEERIIHDGSIADQLEVAAADLIDDYSRGELSVEDAQRVEDYVLSAPGGPQRLAFATALKQVVSSPRAGSRVGRGRLGHWRNRGLAAAAAAGVALGVFSWVELRGVAPSKGPRPDATDSLRKIAAPPSDGNVPRVSFTLALLANQLRGTESESLVIPAHVQRVRIQCELPSTENHALYRLTLENQAGQPLASVDNLIAMHADGIAFVETSLDALLLPAGRYRVALFAASRPDMPVVIREFAVDRRE